MSITLRATKGAKLTSAEMDANFATLRDDALTKAPLDSPALVGTPTAPTQAAGNNSTRLATTAFVKAALDALLNGAPGALDTLKELADAIGDDANFAATVTNALAAINTSLSGKQAKILISGLLKGDGSGGASAAVAGTDYQAPLVSGTNIKTINGASQLGSGDIAINNWTLAQLHAASLLF